MKIIFEKWYKGNVLENWTTIFNNEEELVEFMNKKVHYLLGLDDCYITTRRAKIYNHDLKEVK